MKEFYVDINPEQGNYLQRLGLEVDSKLFLIDRMFSNHANDTDTILFESIPFKYYHQEYEKAYQAYSLAKEEFKNTYLVPLVQQHLNTVEKVNFSWVIEDFLSNQCKIIIEE